jgi:hypothetical protein
VLFTFRDTQELAWQKGKSYERYMGIHSLAIRAELEIGLNRPCWFSAWQIVPTLAATEKPVLDSSR